MSLGHTVPILHLSSRYIQNSKRILFKRFPPTLTLTLIPSNPQPRSPTTVLPEMIVSRHQIPLGKSEEPERRRSIVEPSTTRSPTSSPSSTLLPRRPTSTTATYLLPTTHYQQNIIILKNQAPNSLSSQQNYFLAPNPKTPYLPGCFDTRPRRLHLLPYSIVPKSKTTNQKTPYLPDSIYD